MAGARQGTRGHRAAAATAPSAPAAPQRATLKARQWPWAGGPCGGGSPTNRAATWCDGPPAAKRKQPLCDAEGQYVGSGSVCGHAGQGGRAAAELGVVGGVGAGAWGGAVGLERQPVGDGRGCGESCTIACSVCATARPGSVVVDDDISFVVRSSLHNRSCIAATAVRPLVARATWWPPPCSTPSANTCPPRCVRSAALRLHLKYCTLRARMWCPMRTGGLLGRSRSAACLHATCLATVSDPIHHASSRCDSTRSSITGAQPRADGPRP